MIVNTRRLFSTLLRGMQVNVVCDIGSMNGADALAFRAAAPAARIYALEPNPENFRRMQANPLLQQRRIEALAVAASDFDGEAEFFVVEAQASEQIRRGMSSLYRRSDAWSSSRAVRVQAARLDTLLAEACGPQARLALWIDTEGKAYEVVAGAIGLARQICMLHVEVETSPCIAAEQRLYPDVKALLQRLGFEELATDQAHDRPQLNVLFVRVDRGAALRARTILALVHARLRYLLVAALTGLCPACVRRFHAWRLRRSGPVAQLP